MTARPRIGAIGAGYWGPNLIRNFVEIPDSSVEVVVDRDPARLDHMRTRFPQIPSFTTDLNDLFELDLDAVVITTPPETHFRLASTFLERGLDVFVEKPLATTVDDAEKLVALADEKDRILMVGHIAEHHPALHALKEMVDAGELGEIRYLDTVRVGLGLFHPSLNVVWDLGPHDVSMILHLLDEMPANVTTRGIACVQEDVADVAYMTMSFPSGVLAHSRMSWLDPRKTRRLTVVGSKKMAVYDDVESQEKIRIYDKSVDAIRRTDTFGDFQFAYHYGNIVIPHIQYEEPLRLECLHFLECVMERKRPLTDGRDGLRVVQVIESAQASLRLGGMPVDVGPSAPLLTPSFVDARRLQAVGARSERNGHHAGNGSRGQGLGVMGLDGAGDGEVEPTVVIDLRESS